MPTTTDHAAAEKLYDKLSWYLLAATGVWAFACPLFAAVCLAASVITTVVANRHGYRNDLQQYPPLKPRTNR